MSAVTTLIRTGRSKCGRLARRAVVRIRQRGRSAAVRALRLTGAAVAAYVVAEALGYRNPPPLVAALTALIVVQVTLSGTLVNGVQRVGSVVSGVALAVLFSSVVGLHWWSLAALIAASIVVGQLLRLGSQLIEVPISAMLVLGVGYAAGAEAAGAGRAVETLIGAVVGVGVNLLFPPAIRSTTRFAGRAVEQFAEEIAALLAGAAAELASEVTVEQTGRWLEDARRLNRHAPRVDRALAHSEESRRLNVRALGTPDTGTSLRGGLDALEHCSVATRSLFRSIHDATCAGVRGDADHAHEARRACAVLIDGLAPVVRTFGRLVRAELEGSAGQEETELGESLKALRADRLALEDVLLTDPRDQPALWELNSALVSIVDRMLLELDVEEHARLRERIRSEAAARRSAARAVGRLRSARRKAVDRQPAHREPGTADAQEPT